MTVFAQKEIIVGKCQIERWFNLTGWAKVSSLEHICDSSDIFLLRTYIQKISCDSLQIIIFGGSWCVDTESELPKIIYLLSNELNIDSNQILLYGVDRQKLEPSGLAKKYAIQRVPTLIIQKNGEEIGRIVEYPPAHSNWCREVYSILIKQKKGFEK